ncbi:hypothetical protein AB2S25_18160, partial [Elizabethkingia anophelis]
MIQNKFTEKVFLSAGELFLLSSCRGTDTENSLISGSKASVNINLVVASFKYEVSGSSQSSSGRNISGLPGGVITGRSVLSSGAVLDFSGAGFPTANATASPVFINSDSGGATTGVFSA